MQLFIIDYLYKLTILDSLESRSTSIDPFYYYTTTKLFIPQQNDYRLANWIDS